MGRCLEEVSKNYPNIIGIHTLYVVHSDISTYIRCFFGFSGNDLRIPAVFSLPDADKVIYLYKYKYYCKNPSVSANLFPQFRHLCMQLQKSFVRLKDIKQKGEVSIG